MALFPFLLTLARSFLVHRVELMAEGLSPRAKSHIDSANERAPVWNEGEKRRTCYSRSGRRYSPARGCAKRCSTGSLTALIFIETGTESYRFKRTVAAKKKVKEQFEERNCRQNFGGVANSIQPAESSGRNWRKRKNAG